MVEQVLNNFNLIRNNYTMKFLLYGANGYTGKLITRFAKEYGLEPILAGRTEAKVKALADEFGYPYRAFSLDDQAALDEALKEVSVVIHAAGPFIHTALPMMNACFRTGTHYLDITGEIQVFELGYRLHKKALDANIMLLPGSGFDVVPTDCLALYLKKQMPDATHLKLAFANVGGGLSHGTAKTMVEGMGKGGAVRQKGKIIPVPLGHKSMTVPFMGKSLFAISFPWGDVSTAFYSTGIPNIEVYMSFPPSKYRYVKLQRYFSWFLQSKFMKDRARKKIDKKPAGPSDERRANASSLVWGEVKNAQGQSVQARLITPEGYTLTAHTALIIAQKVLSGDYKLGFQTPAKAYGENLVMEVEGVKREQAVTFELQ